MPRGALTFAVLLAFAGCSTPARPEFVSQSDHFKVRFGGPPRVREREVGGKRSVVYSVDSADGAATVAVTELPLKGDEPPEAGVWVLDSAKADLLRESGGKVTSEGSRTIAGKYPGREFSARVTDPHAGVLRARIYLAGNRLYQVVVMGTAEYAHAPAADAFLDSFMVTD